MTTFFQGERGSMSLLTILLLPMVIVVSAGVLELGMARLVASRARLAADLATSAAVNEQDPDHLARMGGLRIGSDAAQVARTQLTLGLAPIAGRLAATPERIVASADVGIFPMAGSIDPRTGRAYLGPTVRIAADVPIRTPAFGALFGRPITVIRVISASSAR